MIEKAELVIQRNEAISSSNDFLTSPGKMEKFDAACMLIQVVGTSFHMNMALNPNKFLVSSRNICLSSSYAPKKIIEDLKQNKYDSIFD